MTEMEGCLTTNQRNTETRKSWDIKRRHYSNPRKGTRDQSNTELTKKGDNFSKNESNVNKREVDTWHKPNDKMSIRDHKDVHRGGRRGMGSYRSPRYYNRRDSQRGVHNRSVGVVEGAINEGALQHDSADIGKRNNKKWHRSQRRNHRPTKSRIDARNKHSRVTTTTRDESRTVKSMETEEKIKNEDKSYPDLELSMAPSENNDSADTNRQTNTFPASADTTGKKTSRKNWNDKAAKKEPVSVSCHQGTHSETSSNSSTASVTAATTTSLVDTAKAGAGTCLDDNTDDDTTGFVVCCEHSDKIPSPLPMSMNDPYQTTMPFDVMAPETYHPASIGDRSIIPHYALPHAMPMGGPQMNNYPCYAPCYYNTSPHMPHYCPQTIPDPSCFYNNYSNWYATAPTYSAYVPPPQHYLPMTNFPTMQSHIHDPTITPAYTHGQCVLSGGELGTVEENLFERKKSLNVQAPVFEPKRGQ